MKKSDLVDEVAKVVETKKAAQGVVECIFSAITKALQEQGAVTISGFGTFKASRRPARIGRNPMTGNPIQIKARTVPKFIPGRGLKSALNGFEVNPSN